MVSNYTGHCAGGNGVAPTSELTFPGLSAKTTGDWHGSPPGMKSPYMGNCYEGCTGCSVSSQQTFPNYTPTVTGPKNGGLDLILR